MQMTSRFIAAFLFLSIIVSCSNPAVDEITVNEGPLKYSVETEEPGTQKSDLFVFVGQKIEVVEFTPPNREVWFDSAFDAKYKIIEKVYGEFDGGIIEFRAFDHYGFPPFAKYQHALLFVSKYKGKLYHEKYVFYEAYKTSDGRWASCGDPYLHAGEYHRKPFTPKPLYFPSPVVFDRQDLTDKKFREIYSPPYFEVNGKKATCKMGAYVDELFSIERNGVLKARGLF
mgnify:CR=1 FL=1